MEYFIKQNKVYLAGVGAMLVAVLLWWLFVLSPITAATETLRIDRENAKSELESKMVGGVATEDMIVRGQKDLERTKELVKTLSAETAYVAKDPFKWPDATAAEKFSDINIGEWRKIRERAQASRVGVAQNTSPFQPLPPGADPKVAQEMLARLATMVAVCGEAVKSRVDRIERVNPTPDLDADKMVDGSVKPRFLNSFPVKVTVMGESTAIFKIVHALSKKGEFTALTSFWMTKEDEHTDYWKAEIEATALLIDDKLPIVPAEKKE